MAIAVSRTTWRSPAVVAAGAVALASAAAIVLLRSGAAEAAALIGLPAIAVATLRSLWVSYGLLIAIICLAPFATLPLGGPLTPTLLELALLTAFTLQGAVLLMDRRAHLRVGGVQALWVLMAGTMAFAFLLGVGRGYSRQTEHTFAGFMLAIGAFWLTIQIVDRVGDAQRIVEMLVGGTTLAATVALALYAGGPSVTERALARLVPYGYPGSRIVRFIEDDPSKPMRAVGTSVDPNSFGGLLMVGFVLAVAAFLARSRSLPRWMAVAAIVAIGPALLLTYSRGAWVGATVGTALLLAARRPRWLVPLALVAASGIALGAGRGFVERLWLGFTLQDPATKLRLQEYRNALAIIRRNPWFGVGFGDAPSIDLQTGVSSIYLTIAERAGFVGLSAFLIVVAVILWRGIPGIRTPGPRGDVALAATAALVAALATGLVDHYFFNPNFAHMAALFWILAGILVALDGMTPPPRAALQAGAIAVRSRKRATIDLGMHPGTGKGFRHGRQATRRSLRSNRDAV